MEVIRSTYNSSRSFQRPELNHRLSFCQLNCLVLTNLFRTINCHFCAANNKFVVNLIEKKETAPDTKCFVVLQSPRQNCDIATNAKTLIRNQDQLDVILQNATCTYTFHVY